jgi:hypothetical protein
MSVSLGDMCDDPETLIHSSSIDWMEQFRRASMLFSISIRRAILCHTYKQQSGGWSGGSWWDFEDEVQEPRTWLPGSSVGPAAGQGTTKHFTTQHDILQQIHFQPYHTHQNTRPGSGHCYPYNIYRRPGSVAEENQGQTRVHESACSESLRG